MRRIAIVAIAIIAILLGAALVVREAALAADATVSWPLPRWWHEILDGPPWLAAVVGLLAAAGGAVCLWLALGMLAGGGPDGGAAIELGPSGERVAVTAGAVEHLLAHALIAGLPEVKSARVWVSRHEQRLDTRALLVLAVTDLSLLHARAGAIVQREMRVATGLQVGELVVEVDDVLADRGGST